MAVIITDAAIIASLRSKGLAGKISNKLVADIRLEMATTALLQCLAEIGVKPGKDFTHLIEGVRPAAEVRLQEMADALNPEMRVAA